MILHNFETQAAEDDFRADMALGLQDIQQQLKEGTEFPITTVSEETVRFIARHILADSIRGDGLFSYSDVRRELGQEVNSLSSFVVAACMEGLDGAVMTERNLEQRLMHNVDVPLHQDRGRSNIIHITTGGQRQVMQFLPSGKAVSRTIMPSTMYAIRSEFRTDQLLITAPHSVSDCDTNSRSLVVSMYDSRYDHSGKHNLPA